MPAVRRLCAALKAPAAPPHVLAGVCSILTLPLPLPVSGLGGQGVSYSTGTGTGTGMGTGTADEGPRKRDKIAALIIAVFLFVATRLVGRETSGGEYSRRKEIGIQALRGVGGGGGGGGEDGEEIEGRDVDGWVREIGARGWQTLDWFANVREGSGLGFGRAGEEGEEEGGEGSVDEGGGESGAVGETVTPVRRRFKGLETRNVNVGTLQAGLGTMVSYGGLVCVVGRSADSAVDAG